MKIFVKYNAAGELLSVCKVETMPENVDQPYGLLGDKEFVMEVPATNELSGLESLQFHEKFKVDVSKKKLIKKS